MHFYIDDQIFDGPYKGIWNNPNNALNAGAKLENLHITTLDVKKKHIRSHNIIGKCACENCTYTFKGKVKNNNSGWKE